VPRRRAPVGTQKPRRRAGARSPPIHCFNPPASSSLKTLAPKSPFFLLTIAAGRRFSSSGEPSFDPHTHTFSFLPSTCLGAHPASSSALQGPRRRPPFVAATSIGPPPRCRLLPSEPPVRLATSPSSPYACSPGFALSPRLARSAAVATASCSSCHACRPHTGRGQAQEGSFDPVRGPADPWGPPISTHGCMGRVALAFVVVVCCFVNLKYCKIL
jgi:hypothetical protein